jgi:hypothetical protein
MTKRAGSAHPTAGRCGARLRGKDAGRFCTVERVKGRPRCRNHGGLSPRAAAHPRTTHGLYSKGALGIEVFVQPFAENELKLVDRWRRDPEEALRLQLAEGAVVQHRALRAGAIEIYSRLGTMIATTARALVSLREVPPPERSLPKFVEAFEGKELADFERDLEIIKRDAEVGSVSVVRRR